LRRRLDLAEQAHRIGEGSIVDSVRFAQSVSGNGRPDDLGELAARAEAELSRLHAETPKELDGALGQPLETAAAILRQAATALDDIATLTARVDLIRGASGTCKEALAAAKARRAAAAIEDAHREDNEAAQVLGSWFALDIEPEQFVAAVAWTRELRDSLNTPASGAAARRLTSVTPDASDLTAALERWQTALEECLVEFAVERRGEVASDLESHFVDAAHLLDRLRDTRGDIEIWLAHATAISALTAVGLDDAVRFCVEQHIPVGQVVDVLCRSALEAMADAMLALRKESLGALRSVDRDRLVREYAGLDRKVVGDAAHRVMAAANARRPNTVLGLATVIANEAQKSESTCRWRICSPRPRLSPKP
jgi:hypothetical protein